VTTNNIFGKSIEKVYEVHHLEFLPPY